MKYTIKTKVSELVPGDKILTPGSKKTHIVISVTGNEVKVKGAIVVGNIFERVLDNMMEAIR